MSCKVMYTCDHCGKEVSPYIGKQWKAGFLTVGPNIEDIHACSFDHLTLALAKTFDIPLDASTLRLVTEKNDALNAARAAIVECDNMRARLAELEARMPANEVTNAERAQYDQTISAMQAALNMAKRDMETVMSREAALHVALSDHGLPTEPKALARQLAQRNEPAVVDKKTPVDLDNLAKKLVPVFEQAFKDGPNNRLQSVRAGIRAVLAALPMPFAQPMTVDGKTPGQTDDALFDLYMDHAGFFDMNGTMIERENMIETLAAIEQEQAITLPTKPTKPLRERLEDLASYWEKGAASGSMSEGYRQASKDCAKELREVIDDLR